MKTTVVERRAELLRLYTGLPWQSARRRVNAAAPGSLLIAQPTADQLLLEAGVMAALAWRQITTVHPWGIEYVDPRPDRLLIRFEADPDELPDPDETQVLDLAEVLLPRADEHGEIAGVPGACTHVENGNVVLRMVGTSASVTLLGLDPDQWLHAVDMKDQELRAWGLAPCRPTQSARGLVRRHTAVSAWLAAGLLRRVGLIRTLGVPLAVTGWRGHSHPTRGERWIIDPMFVNGCGATGHRRLMALLAAPGWGLPFAGVDEHCNCHLSPDFSEQCTTSASGPPGMPGVLEVRAIHRRGDDLRQIQQDHPAIYAAQQQLALPVPSWIDRWLEHGGAAVSVGPVGAALSS